MNLPSKVLAFAFGLAVAAPALAAPPAMTRDQIIDLVWGNDFFGTDRIVDVYVGQVRRKLEQAGAPDLIQTVRGVGYKFTTKAE